MDKRCKHVRQDGVNCGSYAFNLYKDDIDQGDLCDVHYWQAKAQRTEQNFCPRCGKRTADLTTIHTCTPPQRTEPIQSLQCFHCQVTIETLNDKVMQLMAQRTWVGLTDEEICMFSMWLDSKPDATVFTAIEARLKELNT